MSAFIAGWDRRGQRGLHGCGQQGPCGQVLQDGGDVLGNLAGGAGAC